MLNINHDNVKLSRKHSIMLLNSILTVLCSTW